MKLHLDMDVTPEEMRRLLGLPDMQPLHDELLEMMKQQLQENMDPAKLVENYLSNSLSSMEAFQRFMTNYAKAGQQGGK